MCKVLMAEVVKSQIFFWHQGIELKEIDYFPVGFRGELQMIEK